MFLTLIISTDLSCYLEKKLAFIKLRLDHFLPKRASLLLGSEDKPLVHSSVVIYY